MPRDGSGNYTLLPGTDGVPGEPVESAPYNAMTADFELDANLPRPVIAGGTGAGNAAGARTNLQAEVNRQVVTNYDSHIWESGSFYSASGATNAPVGGHVFSGIVIVLDINNILVEARDLDDTAVPGKKYVRQKRTTWGPWTYEDADVVAKSGDTMSGNLVMNPGEIFFNAGSGLRWDTTAFHVDNTTTGTFKFRHAGTTFFTIAPGIIEPATPAGQDLGSSSLPFSDLFLSDEIHLDDTTIVRQGSLDLSIGPSNLIYRQDGTDVAIADGGTGAGSAATAFANLKQPASTTATGVVELADNNEMVTGTDATRAVTPATMPRHKGVAKWWVQANSGGTFVSGGDYNISSVTDTGVGLITVNLVTAMAGGPRQVAMAMVTGVACYVFSNAPTANSQLFGSRFHDGVGTDPTFWYIMGHGDLA